MPSWSKCSWSAAYCTARPSTIATLSAASLSRFRRAPRPRRPAGQRLPVELPRLGVVRGEVLAQPVVAHDVRQELVEGAEPAPVGGDLPLLVDERADALVGLLDALEVLAQRLVLGVHQRVDERVDEALLAPEVVGDQGPVLARTPPRSPAA